MSADFESRVMARVRAETPVRSLDESRPRTVASGLWTWLARPKTVQFRPVTAFALAAVLAALAILPGALAKWPSTTAGAEPRTAAAASTDPVLVVAADSSLSVLTHFVLVAPSASGVSLVGDFNDWRAGETPLTSRAEGGVWTVTIPLAPGRHSYAFVVDGARWMADPAAPGAQGDDFGSPSSVVTVTPERS